MGGVPGPHRPPPGARPRLPPSAARRAQARPGAASSFSQRSSCGAKYVMMASAPEGGAEGLGLEPELARFLPPPSHLGPFSLTCAPEGGHRLHHRRLEAEGSSLGAVPQHGELPRDVVHRQRVGGVLRAAR